jgi:hypothetical protein
MGVTGSTGVPATGVPATGVPATGVVGPVGGVVATGVVVVVVLVVVVVGGVALGVAHVAIEMVFVSRVTAPFWARRLPSMEAPVVMVMLDSARMLPTKLVEVPNVAELPTVQNTLHACAPLARITELEEAVVSVDAA